MTLQTAGKTLLMVLACFIGLFVVLWLGLAFAAPDLVREKATSAKGFYAETIVDGVPLSDGTRVVVWQPGWPHLQILGCKVLESYHEQPTKLRWSGDVLHVDHAYTVAQITASRADCGTARIQFARTLSTYS